jgi:hypothetical protein
MKNFVERYSWSEFQLIEEIRSVLRIIRPNRFKGNYQPYQIKHQGAYNHLGFSAKIGQKEISIYMHAKNLQLDYAIQVWEIAQDLTKQQYGDYLDYTWKKEKDNPFAELKFLSKSRDKAEKCFLKMLEEVCTDKKIFSSEKAVFKKHISERPYKYEQFILDVCIDADQITDDMRKKLHQQFSNNVNHFTFEKTNRRYTFQEIKEYFVYINNHLQSLLNVEDGIPKSTNAEKELFECTVKLDYKGILNAISNGASINAIDKNGETAFTKLIKTTKYDFLEIENDEYLEKRETEIQDFTKRKIIELATKLLEMGADINLFGYDGLNALQYTAYFHDAVLMKFLLDHGANPNINFYPEDGMDYIISTPLDSISDDFDLDTVDTQNLEACYKLLIEAGAQ